MANVAITVPDALVPRLTAAARATFPQYAGLSDAAAFRAITADHWRSILVGYEVGLARAIADTNVNAQQATSTNDAGGIA